MSDCKTSFERVLLTLGATREFIDPVRYISNRSSGKMGVALIKAFQELGCNVCVIKAHCESIDIPSDIEMHEVSSSSEMLASVNQQMINFKPQLFVGCAAVSDFIPQNSANKIKKQQGINLIFEQAPDIIAGVVGRCPYVAGFAAETTNIQQNAYKKMHGKGLDVIFANDARCAMGSDSNQVVIVTKNNFIETEKMTKEALAKLLVQWLKKDWLRKFATNRAGT